MFRTSRLVLGATLLSALMATNAQAQRALPGGGQPAVPNGAQQGLNNANQQGLNNANQQGLNNGGQQGLNNANQQGLNNGGQLNSQTNQGGGIGGQNTTSLQGIANALQGNANTLQGIGNALLGNGGGPTPGNLTPTTNNNVPAQGNAPATGNANPTTGNVNSTKTLNPTTGLVPPQGNGIPTPGSVNPTTPPTNAQQGYVGSLQTIAQSLQANARTLRGLASSQQSNNNSVPGGANNPQQQLNNPQQQLNNPQQQLNNPQQQLNDPQQQQLNDPQQLNNGGQPLNNTGQGTNNAGQGNVNSVQGSSSQLLQIANSLGPIATQVSQAANALQGATNAASNSGTQAQQGIGRTLLRLANMLQTNANSLFQISGGQGGGSSGTGLIGGGGFGFGPYGYGGFGGGSSGVGNVAANVPNGDALERWNAYMHDSQLQANQQERSRTDRKLERNRLAGDVIYQRIRDNPNAGDIEKGDALNAALDQITDPKVQSVAPRHAKVPVDRKMIAVIPFVHASDALTISLNQLTGHESWPTALRGEAFDAVRKDYRETVAQALKEDEEGEIAPATVERARAAAAALRTKLKQSPPADNAERVEAENYVKGLLAMTRMLKKPEIEKIVGELSSIKETTLGSLLTFMHSYSLRFGVAGTAEQKAAYKQLYPLMADLRDRVVQEDRTAASAASDTAPPPAPEPTTENKAVKEKPQKKDKGRPTDFFQSMHLDHLDQ